MSKRHVLTAAAFAAVIFWTGFMPGTGSGFVSQALAQSATNQGDPISQPINGPKTITLPTAAPSAAKKQAPAPSITFKGAKKTAANDGDTTKATAPAVQLPAFIQGPWNQIKQLATSLLDVLPAIMEPLQIAAMLILLIGYTVFHFRRVQRVKLQAELEKNEPAPEFGEPDPRVYRSWESRQADDSRET